MKSEQMLTFYAGRLSTVEVNTTFYRTQPPEIVSGWVRAVPDEFRFAVKAHRRITHNRRMPNLEGAMRILAEEAEGFGSYLGPVLFQLPPTAPFEEGRVERILSQAPAHWRVAFQFRHPSWHQSQVASLLERRGMAMVHGDGEEQPGPLGRGAFVYLRLRREAYSPQRLGLWSRRIKGYLADGRDVYVYFKHERMGPLYAERLASMSRTSFRARGEAAL
jgi:uncharacterized protein YecE (DUF72 family)